ncbi:MAG: hypothetical protein MRZ79_16185 [Bacteroidia bacterium]|nr:hypothetical protein [Bacteroidia bacterium]
MAFTTFFLLEEDLMPTACNEVYQGAHIFQASSLEAKGINLRCLPAFAYAYFFDEKGPDYMFICPSVLINAENKVWNIPKLKQAFRSLMERKLRLMRRSPGRIEAACMVGIDARLHF